MKTAIITLIGPANYVVGQYRFKKNSAVKTSDKSLIEYLRYNPSFKVEGVEEKSVEPAKPKASKAKSAKSKKGDSAKFEKVSGKDVIVEMATDESKKAREVEA